MSLRKETEVKTDPDETEGGPDDLPSKRIRYYEVIETVLDRGGQVTRREARGVIDETNHDPPTPRSIVIRLPPTISIIWDGVVRGYSAIVDFFSRLFQ